VTRTIRSSLKVDWISLSIYIYDICLTSSHARSPTPRVRTNVSSPPPTHTHTHTRINRKLSFATKSELMEFLAEHDVKVRQNYKTFAACQSAYIIVRSLMLDAMPCSSVGLRSWLFHIINVCLVSFDSLQETCKIICWFWSSAQFLFSLYLYHSVIRNGIIQIKIHIGTDALLSESFFCQMTLEFSKLYSIEDLWTFIWERGWR